MSAYEMEGLLGRNDPAPFCIHNAEGASPFLLIGDHAGSAIPQTLGDLGLAPIDRERHIAIDIGVAGMGGILASLLDAPFLHQPYSRLVIDCNRDPARPDAMPASSDGTMIAGNAALNNTARAARIAAIHTPYHAAISRTIAARQATGRPTILLSLHSFTPVMDGIARPWHIGVMHWQGRTAFAHALRDALCTVPGIVVGDNQPYAMDATDFTVPRHAFPNDLPYAEIEVRQDQIASRPGQRRWAGIFAQAVREALD